MQRHKEIIEKSTKYRYKYTIGYEGKKEAEQGEKKLKKIDFGNTKANSVQRAEQYIQFVVLLFMSYSQTWITA